MGPKGKGPSHRKILTLAQVQFSFKDSLGLGRKTWAQSPRASIFPERMKNRKAGNLSTSQLEPCAPETALLQNQPPGTSTVLVLCNCSAGQIARMLRETSVTSLFPNPGPPPGMLPIVSHHDHQLRPPSLRCTEWTPCLS